MKLVFFKSKRVWVKPHQAKGHTVKGAWRTDKRTKKKQETKLNKRKPEHRELLDMIRKFNLLNQSIEDQEERGYAMGPYVGSGTGWRQQSHDDQEEDPEKYDRLKDRAANTFIRAAQLKNKIIKKGKELGIKIPSYINKKMIDGYGRKW